MASNPQGSIRLALPKRDPRGSEVGLRERTQAGLSVRAGSTCSCGELEQQVRSQPHDPFVTLTGFRFGLGRGTLRWLREPESEVPFIPVSEKVTEGYHEVGAQ